MLKLNSDLVYGCELMYSVENILAYEDKIVDIV